MNRIATLLAVPCFTNLALSQVAMQRTADHRAVAEPTALAPTWKAASKPDLEGTPKSASVIQLGSAPNLYTFILSGQNQVDYNEDINTVIFQHRSDPDNHDGLGGVGTLRVDFSTDGGATWSLDTLLITPAMFAGTAGDATGNRYPNGAIYNPAGNTDPMSAFVVSNGPALSATTTLWGLIARASTRLDGSYATDAYVDQWGDLTSFHPYGLCVNPNGEAWSLSSRYGGAGDPLNYTGYHVNKGVFNAGTHAFDWTVQQTITPDFHTDPDSSVIYSSHNLAFSPDGTTGYAVIMGKENDGIPQGPCPLVWKTADGGATWNQLPTHDFSTEPALTYWLLPAFDSGLPRPYFSDFDCVVDGDGTLHLISEVLSGYTASPDSQGYIFSDIASHFIFHVATNDGVNWHLYKLSDVFGTDFDLPSSDPANIPVQSNRPQASRTSDGSRVFFSWNSSGPDETQNYLPDVWAVGHEPATGLYTEQKNLTAGTDAELVAFLHSVSPVCITGGSEHDYELPIVFGAHNGDALGPADFYYIRGVGFDDADFVVGLIEPAPPTAGLFPNPTDGPLRINLTSAAAVDLSLADATGRIVLRERKVGPEIVLDLSGHRSGIYHLTLTQDRGMRTLRVMLQ